MSHTVLGKQCYSQLKINNATHSLRYRMIIAVQVKDFYPQAKCVTLEPTCGIVQMRSSFVSNYVILEIGFLPLESAL